MLPPNYQIRLMGPSDFEEISEICKLVYPAETPYTFEELEAHHRVFPQGQFVALYSPQGQGAVAGVHFTLRLRMIDFHFDDPWDVLTARGTFSDHNPVTGHTLYGADIMVHPVHQHHGIAHALTDITRILVREEGLWRMVGASRLPGYGKRCALMGAEQYVGAVERGELVDPVLTTHLRDGWTVVRPIRGYLPHDDESDGWAAVIQWVNPECPPPPEFELR
jgi:GNAT superfamily N-acetyltransferase